MPRENKKRGRRMGDRKRKHDDADDGSELQQEGVKRPRSVDDTAAADGDEPMHNAAFLDPETLEQDGLDGGATTQSPFETPFFGMLDEEEQEYFKRADDMLEANSFVDPEERGLFLANVYREAEGKELKIAMSQSCSRLLERLIQMSTAAQLKGLFQRFSGNFIHLVSHRFASHCCEALFLRAAPFVTQELLAPTNGSKANIDPSEDDVYVSLETLYLHTFAELQGNIGYLITEKFASHVLRVFLLVLAGEPMDTQSTKYLLASKRKENNFVKETDSSSIEALSKSRSVPESFSQALEQTLGDSVAGLDTDKVRALATHPNGSPTLQLLLKIELTHFGKSRAKNEKSIIRTLLPDDPIRAETDSAKFINGLIYDSIGSHLVERIVQYAPGKMFKSMYSEFFKDRLASLARNEIAGHVVCRILERLGPDDLLVAHEMIVPHVTDLLRKNRTMVVKTLIERCVARDIDTQAIAVGVDATWHGPTGFVIKKLLKFGDQSVKGENGETTSDHMQTDHNERATATHVRHAEPTKTHFNLLAQSMLLVPGSLSALVLDSLVTCEPGTLLGMSRDFIVSRTLQAALTARTASMILTRKLIQHFYGHMADMAVDTAASHVVDSMWEGTHGLAFIRERIAEELAEAEGALRESSCGRAVWRNWKMDLYKRKRGDWIKQSKVKASNDGFQSLSELDSRRNGLADGLAGGEVKKTPLQLARERHMREKAAKAGGGGTKGGGGPAKSATAASA